MIVKLKDLKQELKRIAARTFWAYGSDELVKRLRQCGVVPGTTLMLHSSWNPFGGFQGAVWSTRGHRARRTTMSAG